jgi:HEAT repeat protein
VEVNNLLAGRDYDVSVLEGSNADSRQMITEKLLAAATGPHPDQQERARRAFLDHGYFDVATRDLRTADSPAERAGAARKLGAAGSRVATAHLTAALFDSAPEVRHAAVEGLGQLGDPAAIGPLNDLLVRETSPELPADAIRHSIHAIAF